MEIREVFFEKWRRNCQFVTNFKIMWEDYLNQTDTWKQLAFYDSSATNEQAFLSLKQVSDLEYSDTQYQGMLNMQIHENAYQDYIRNLDIQYDNLKIMYDEIIKKK